MHLVGFIIRMVMIIYNNFLSCEELWQNGTEREQTMPGRSIVLYTRAVSLKTKHRLVSDTKPP